MDYIILHPRHAGKSWWHEQYRVASGSLPRNTTMRFIIDEYREPLITTFDETAGLHKNKVAVKQRLKQNPRTRKAARWS